jgi:hypothetical protein
MNGKDMNTLTPAVNLLLPLFSAIAVLQTSRKFLMKTNECMSDRNERRIVICIKGAHTHTYTSMKDRMSAVVWRTKKEQQR